MNDQHFLSVTDVTWSFDNETHTGLLVQEPGVTSLQWGHDIDPEGDIVYFVKIRNDNTWGAVTAEGVTFHQDGNRMAGGHDTAKTLSDIGVRLFCGWVELP